MDTSSLLFAAGISYFVICMIIGFVGRDRGHGFAECFIISIVCTPLIGAILYSHYKPK